MRIKELQGMSGEGRQGGKRVNAVYTSVSTCSTLVSTSYREDIIIKNVLVIDREIPPFSTLRTSADIPPSL